VVDLGRYTEGNAVSDSWLRRSDASVLVVPGDASAAVNLRERAPRLLDSCDGRLGLVVVGGNYRCRELAEFTGMVGLADLPFDPSAAAAVRGTPGTGRRLELSLLWAAVRRLAVTLSDRLESDWPTGQPGDVAPVSPPRPRRASSKRGIGRFRSRADRQALATTDLDHVDDEEVDPFSALREVGA
jgi:hypothetical protein